MNDDNPGRQSATQIDPGTAQRSPNAGRSPEKAVSAPPRGSRQPMFRPFPALPGVLERGKVAFGIAYTAVDGDEGGVPWRVELGFAHLGGEGRQLLIGKISHPRSTRSGC